ncbi:MAG: amino acid permease [Nocardioides sp.]|uniref:amino acid permease n=1 Tax=Nocardioides sp. TaxID=35761 RepID=UPI0039E67F23
MIPTVTFIQIGTRVRAAGKWRALDTAASFKQQGAIRALGTAVIAAHPKLAAVLDAHGLTLDPVTGEVTELEQFNAVLSKRAAQVERNLARFAAEWENAHPGQEPGPVVRARLHAKAWDHQRPYIFKAWLPHWTADFYLALLLGIEILGCNAFFTAVSRQLFGMARAGQLPAARTLSKTRNGTPYAAILTVGVFTALPLLIAQQMSVLAGGATAGIYVAYVLLLLVLLIARLRGWPKRDAPFKLGGWGIPANLMALVLGAASLLTLVWPRDDTNPEVWGMRAAYWMVGIPIVLGAVVYLARGGERAVASESDLLQTSELESQAEAASNPHLS